MLTKRTTIILLSVLVVVGVFGVVEPTHAISLDDIGEKVIAKVFFNIFRWIVIAAGGLISIAAGTLSVVLRIDFVPDFVRETWTTFRNFANIGFIVFLVPVSFGTIFNVSGWTYRELLAPGLTAALLINFSYPIAEFVFAFANQLSRMLLFVIGDVSFVFAEGVSLQKFTSYGASLEGLGNSVAESFSSLTSFIVNSLFYVIFMVISLITIALVTLFAVLRIPFIWGLVALSPFAFFGLTLPNLRKSLWSRWWQYFFKWNFSVPLFLVPVALAAVFITSQGLSTNPANGTGTTTATIGQTIAQNENNTSIITTGQGTISSSLLTAQAGTTTTTSAGAAATAPNGFEPATNFLGKFLGFDDIFTNVITIVLFLGGLQFAWGTASSLGINLGKLGSLAGKYTKRAAIWGYAKAKGAQNITWGNTDQAWERYKKDFAEEGYTGPGSERVRRLASGKIGSLLGLKKKAIGSYAYGLGEDAAYDDLRNVAGLSHSRSAQKKRRGRANDIKGLYYRMKDEGNVRLLDENKNKVFQKKDAEGNWVTEHAMDKDFSVLNDDGSLNEEKLAIAEMYAETGQNSDEAFQGVLKPLLDQGEDGITPKEYIDASIKGGMKQLQDSEINDMVLATKGGKYGYLGSDAGKIVRKKLVKYMRDDGRGKLASRHLTQEGFNASAKMLGGWGADETWKWVMDMAKVRPDLSAGYRAEYQTKADGSYKFKAGGKKNGAVDLNAAMESVLNDLSGGPSIYGGVARQTWESSEKTGEVFRSILANKWVDYERGNNKTEIKPNGEIRWSVGMRQYIDTRHRAAESGDGAREKVEVLENQSGEFAQLQKFQERVEEYALTGYRGKVNNMKKGKDASAQTASLDIDSI